MLRLTRSTHGIRLATLDLMTALAMRRHDLTVAGQHVRVATAERPGTRAPVVALHGFGSTKEDCKDPAAVTVPFLVGTAEALLDEALDDLHTDRFHLVGHSMGGLTALLLAARRPDRVLSFTDVEGNLAPEDCFLSRQLLTNPHDNPDSFLDAFVERARTSTEPGSALYAAGVRAKVPPELVAPIFNSMVELSDSGDLLPTFVELPFPRMFVHREHNVGLTYVPALRAAGVEVASIAHSGHWPMYTHPVALWDRI